MTDLRASAHGLRLGDGQDALGIIYSGLPACILTPDDLGEGFFDLRNGRAGDAFQKFVNYGYKVAIVLPDGHGLGARVSELAYEHASHPNVRFVKTMEEAERFLADQIP